MKMKKKILQICNFSSGISGVWTRVLEDSKELIKRGYEVHVFSSNKQEDGKLVSQNKEIKKEIDITRFPVTKQQGYALWFNFEEEALKLRPDIIICHGLRKPYLKPALNIAKKINAKCFCVTHAPFIDKELRSNKLNMIIWFYDKFIGKKIMNSFDKVIAICKWEKENLLDLGCNENKIEYIPNALPNEFFVQDKKEEKKKILYMGRMHPVKEIEVLIKALSNVKKSTHIEHVLEIVSSKGSEYQKELYNLAKELRVPAYFTGPIYNLNKKIRKIDEAEIFVLPSAKESLPFGLIEAMARGKIVVATRTKGGEELIKDCKNGFLFDVRDDYELKLILEKINKMSKEEKDEIKVEAEKTAEQFKVLNVMEKWEELFK